MVTQIELGVLCYFLCFVLWNVEKMWSGKIAQMWSAIISIFFFSMDGQMGYGNRNEREWSRHWERFGCCAVVLPSGVIFCSLRALLLILRRSFDCISSSSSGTKDVYRHIWWSLNIEQFLLLTPSSHIWHKSLTRPMWFQPTLGFGQCSSEVRLRTRRMIYPDDLSI